MPDPTPAAPVDSKLLAKALEESNSKLAPDVKQVDFKQTWDDDAEQIVILHPQQPVHHIRLVICKKTAQSITIEPFMHHPQQGKPDKFDERLTYVRTTEKDTHGRTIFRQGAAT